MYLSIAFTILIIIVIALVMKKSGLGKKLNLTGSVFNPDGTPANKQLSLSKNNKRLAGVCGGIAEYFETDPNTVRFLWALGTFLSIGTGIVIYVIFALFVPEQEPPDTANK